MAVLAPTRAGSGEECVSVGCCGPSLVALQLYVSVLLNLNQSLPSLHKDSKAFYGYTQFLINTGTGNYRRLSKMFVHGEFTTLRNAAVHEVACLGHQGPRSTTTSKIYLVTDDKVLSPSSGQEDDNVIS